MRIFFTISCLIALAGSARGQIRQHLFQRISLEHGLPQGHIYEIFEDREGFIWIGHGAGMSRYDGFEFKTYSDSLAKQNIVQRAHIFCQDQKGMLWMGTTNGLNRFDPQTESIRVFQPDKEDTTSLGNSLVDAIWEDKDGNLWLGTGTGIDFLNTRTLRFAHARPENDQAPKQIGVFAFARYSDGSLWAGTTNGLLRLDPLTCTYRYFLPFPDTPASPYNQELRDILPDGRGGFWIASDGGLLHADIASMRFTPIRDNLPCARIVDLLADEDGSVWIAYYTRGLVKWRPDKGIEEHFLYAPNDPHGIINDRIYSLGTDHFKNLWIGTFNGINRVNFREERFELYRNEVGLDNNANYILALAEDAAGGIWTQTPINTYYAPQRGMPSLPLDRIAWMPKVMREHPVNVMHNDKQGRLWLQVKTEGLFAFDAFRGAFTRIWAFNAMVENTVWDFEEDPADPAVVWLATARGLSRLDIRSGQMEWFYPKDQLPDLFSNYCGRILLDSRGHLWVAFSLGAGRFDPKDRHWTAYKEEKNNPNSLIGGGVCEMVEMPAGTLWMPTMLALHKIDLATGKITRYSFQAGLPQKGISAILPHRRTGKLWISILNYLTCFDPVSETFKSYNFLHEVNKEFNWRAACTGKDGRLYFGGINGLYAFVPENLTEGAQPPKIALTDIKVLNRSASFYRAANALDKFELPYDENVVTFEFAGLYFVAPGRVRHLYKLESFDKDWQEAGSERRATYTNLNPGHYRFRVKAANGEGQWSAERSVEMVILPPFWATWWFRTLVALALATMVYTIMRNRRAQLQLRRQKELAEQNTRYKSQFLANMSHEIRTPLNAIIGLNRLLLDTPLDAKQRQWAQSIQQSGEDLVWIINDVLDQAKIESGKYSFIHKPFELDNVLRHLQHLFEFKAQEKGLAFAISVAPEVPNSLVGDPVRLNQILTNLLGNAIKFTETGAVHLAVDYPHPTTGAHGRLRFQVRDTGVGIAADKLEKVFESFEQANEDPLVGQQGTGLGLSIARQLVEQQGGTIAVTSCRGEGAVFTVILPFALAFQTKAPAAADSTTANPSLGGALSAGLRILLVEDTYFNQMLAVELLKKYLPAVDVDTAENGQVAVEKVQIKPYDLILMDVKMPVMDGYEATRAIRALDDARVARLPILGLTANAIPEQLEQCRQAGMNDVLAKPIHADELMTKILNLVSTDPYA